MSGLYREKARVTRVRPYAGTTSIKVDTHDTRVFHCGFHPAFGLASKFTLTAVPCLAAFRKSLLGVVQGGQWRQAPCRSVASGPGLLPKSDQPQ